MGLADFGAGLAKRGELIAKGIETKAKADKLAAAIAESEELAKPALERIGIDPDSKEGKFIIAGSIDSKTGDFDFGDFSDGIKLNDLTPEGKLAIAEGEAEDELGIDIPTGTPRHEIGAIRRKTKFDDIRKTKEIGEEVKAEAKESEEILKMESDIAVTTTLFKRAEGVRRRLEEKYPNINAATTAGLVTRSYIKVKAAAQLEPEVQAYQKRSRLAAFRSARAIEGARVTDADVRIVHDTLFNPLGAPSKQDLYQAQFIIQDWEANATVFQDGKISEASQARIVDFKSKVENLLDKANGKVAARFRMTDGNIRTIPLEQENAIEAAYVQGGERMF